jgi:hypothetical protein
LREREKQHPIESVGAHLRGMMSWLHRDSQKQARKPEPAQRPAAKVVNA